MLLTTIDLADRHSVTPTAIPSQDLRDQPGLDLVTRLLPVPRLPRPDPVTETLTSLAARLREQTTAVRSARDEDWWAGYFERQHREAEAAAERCCAAATTQLSLPGFALHQDGHS